MEGRKWDGGHIRGEGIAALLAPPPDASALQPLFTGDGGLVLTPFFSQNGKAPWEEGANGNDEAWDPGDDDDNDDHVVDDLVGGGTHSSSLLPVRSAASNDDGGNDVPQERRSNSKGLALLSRLRMGNPAMSVDEGDDDDDDNFDYNRIPSAAAAVAASQLPTSDWFLTDTEITARSQKEKLGILPPMQSEDSLGGGKQHDGLSILPPDPTEGEEGVATGVEYSRGEDDDSDANDGVAVSSSVPEDEGGEDDVNLEWMKDWVKGLPQATPTKEFGRFSFDVDAIMKSMVVASG